MAQGISVGSFAYLSRSYTLASTILSPIILRTVHWIPLALALVWAFSPMGSQAMLRFVNVEQHIVLSNSTDPVQYYYPASSGQTAGGDAASYVNSANAIILSSLLSVESTLHNPQDAFGNMKVPSLASLNISESSPEWTILPTAPTSFSYSSLVGMPFQRPAGQGNITFTMQSWYWHLDNPTVSLELNATSNNPYPHLSNADKGWLNYTATDWFWQILIPNNTNANASLPFIFEIANPDSPHLTTSSGQASANANAITRFAANLTHQPVELNATCDSSSCRAIAIRSSQFPTPYDPRWDFHFFSLWFLSYLSKAFPLAHLGTPEPGVFESFLNDSSQNPFGQSFTTIPSHPDLSSLGADELGLRLEQVLNAYWIAHSALWGVAGFDSLNVTQLYASAATSNTTVGANTTAIVSNSRPFLVCDEHWLGVLCFSTIVMFIAALVSLVFTILYNGPEANDFLSALTRGYQVPQLEHGSYLHGDDLVREFRDAELKVGDANTGGEVGRIVIGPSGLVGDLQRGRVYS
jgi:hypothetical protein